MKKLLVLLFSILISFNSYGEENWMPTFISSDDSDFYVNLDSIKEVDGYVYWWQMQDYHISHNGHMSHKEYIQGDCALNRMKFLAYYFYKLPMGKDLGDVNNKENSKWFFTPPDSIGSIILSRVCSITSS